MNIQESCPIKSERKIRIDARMLGVLKRGREKFTKSRGARVGLIQFLIH